MDFFTQNEDARKSKQFLDQMIGYNRLNHNYVKNIIKGKNSTNLG